MFLEWVSVVHQPATGEGIETNLRPMGTVEEQMWLRHRDRRGAALVITHVDLHAEVGEWLLALSLDRAVNVRRGDPVNHMPVVHDKTSGRDVAGGNGEGHSGAGVISGVYRACEEGWEHEKGDERRTP